MGTSGKAKSEKRESENSEEGERQNGGKRSGWRVTLRVDSECGSLGWEAAGLHLNVAALAAFSGLGAGAILAGCG
jgi:hypothetical protein